MNVAKLRKLKGWTQYDLAEAAGTTQAHISRLEQAHGGVTLRIMMAVAEALQVPLFRLFYEDAEDEERQLIEIYRSLSLDRRKGWLDMAALVEESGKKAER